ncbi:mechanosensitive ion channel domain-containing protein [Limibacter armeniacum]|uniref:mechanosensitive ion channel family protein n=1 Tax=Limibacter armeniacum TaxID=466084 RepID=UPI002FE609FF
MGDNLYNYSEKLKDLIFEYGPKLVAAIIVLIIGLWVVKALTAMIKRQLDKRNLDPSLKPFLGGLFNMLMKVLLVIAVLSTMGIEMTSFVAILGAAGLAIGMALSGTLQNFAGGVMILIFKPFKVGDFVEAQGFMGVVKEIQIFVTILKTGDNKTIYIPNGPLSTGTLTNYSVEPNRRVEWTFGIGYGDNVDKAQEILRGLIAQDERIHETPEPFIAVSALADSSVNLVVRVWTKSGDLWPVFFDMNKKVYNAFNEQGINIPFPQMDVHVHNNA